MKYNYYVVYIHSASTSCCTFQIDKKIDSSEDIKSIITYIKDKYNIPAEVIILNWRLLSKE